MTKPEDRGLRGGLLLGALLLSGACSTSPNSLFHSSGAGAGGNGSSTAGAAGSGSVASSTGAAGLNLVPLPDAGSDLDSGQKCAPVPVGIVRDFRADGTPNGHPDFEKQTLFAKMDYDPLLGYPEPGIVQARLGADSKPQFSGGPFKTVTSIASFEQWFKDVPGVNTSLQYTLPLTLDQTTNTLVFDTPAFFPIDDQGFGNSGRDDAGKMHNFGFTFELHMKFFYSGGEVFRFRGDDDMFVFIDGARVIDLGGVHAKMEGSVELDSLGLTLNHEYPIDVFQAERHTTQSNFRIETSLAFSNCDPIIIPK